MNDSSIEAIQRSLETLWQILDEKAGGMRIKGRRQAITLREQILRRLRKEVVNGNASAFAVLTRELKEYPRAEAALQQARQALSSDRWFPLLRGGVLEVPKGACIEEVGRMFDRGITEDEMQTLRELACRDFRELHDQQSQPGPT